MKDQVEELTRLGLKVLKALATGSGEEEDETVIKGVIGLHRILTYFCLPCYSAVFRPILLLVEICEYSIV